MAYVWYLRGIFVSGSYMVISWKKIVVWLRFFLTYAIMWDQHVDYSIRAHDQKFMLHVILITLT